MNTYQVTVTREAPYWVAQIAGLPGGATETRALAALEAEVRDLIAGLTDVEEDDIALEWDYSGAFAPDVAQSLGQLQEARKFLEDARAQYERIQLEAVHGVRAQGVSVRDAAVLLHVSHQRISQLAS
ncbi:MerR [Plantibacter sp. CFBP 8804]|uniref:MerR n=1 Tax=Plantibacter sp. CFBP 8804 TaxID=2775270 RepID=UPI00177F2624|nr:MerR [Plantibacter sp. CFBP 8804]MBD8519175.1 MerR [Plantibacter sp. CFBP 8804]